MSDAGYKLAHYWRYDGGPKDGFYGAHLFAEAIIANPQAHIDALVEAGVLEARNQTFGVEWGTAYRVVQPHKHEWRAIVSRVCDCGEVSAVDSRSRITIEVPE